MATIIRIFWMIAALVSAGTAALAKEHLKWGDPEISKKLIPYGECVTLVTEAEKLNRARGLIGLMSKAEFGFSFTKKVDGLNISAQVVAKRINESSGAITNTVTSLNCAPKNSQIETAVSLAELTPKARALKEKKEREAIALKEKNEREANEEEKREKERIKKIEAMEDAANKAFEEAMAKPILPQTSKYRPQRPLTIIEINSVRNQIARCWSLPAEARKAENLSIEIKLIMNPDGTVRQAKILDQARLNREPFFRTVAESALRAVLNPLCNPLKLPPEKYQQWQNMVLILDPRKTF